MSWDKRTSFFSHDNDSCIDMKSFSSHFNVSIFSSILRDKPKFTKLNSKNAYSFLAFL